MIKYDLTLSPHFSYKRSDIMSNEISFVGNLLIGCYSVIVFMGGKMKDSEAWVVALLVADTFWLLVIGVLLAIHLLEGR